MKILVISNLYPPDILGGYELGCRQTVEALRAAGHDVIVLTSAPRGGPVSSEPGVLRRLRLVDVYDNYTDWKSNPTAKAIRSQEACGVHAFNVHSLLEVIDEFQPDVAYVWNVIALGGLGLLASLQYLGVPWVMHLMDCVPVVLCTSIQQGTVSAPLAAAFRRLCRGRFLCCSETTLQEIVSRGVDISDRTRIIPNWVVSAPASRRDYLPDGKLRIVTAGSLASWKGIGILIEAASILRDQGHSHFEVDVYGIGDDSEYRSQIQKFRVQDHVRLRGRRTQHELDQLYPHYDLFAFPTWAREPFGFAPMEALARGCVPVVSSVCGFSEWFVDGIDCLKAERSPRAFAKVFERVLDGTIPLAEIGTRGAMVVRRDFHISAILPSIVAELRAAVREGSRAAGPASEAYRIALLAEKTLACLIHETTAA